MDLLSDLLSTLRLEAGLYFEARLRGDFAIALAAEARRIRFHLALEGDCHISVPGNAPVRLSQGDLVLIPDGAPQVLSSGGNANDPADLAAVLAKTPPQNGVLDHGAIGDLRRLLCGFLRFDEMIDHPVLTSLPPVIVMRAEDGNTALRLLHEEAARPDPGQSFILHRVVEVLLIQAASRQIVSGAQGGFISALGDRRLSRALQAIHTEPQRNWNVESLARVSGISRSRFAARFAQTVGMTPFAYLTRWRMVKASEFLRMDGLDMAEIAERCGYASVPAFSRRFADMYGFGPGEWRRRRSWSGQGVSQ